MSVRETTIITVTRHVDALSQADAARLDALCAEYGAMLSVFLNALQSRELRQQAFHPREFRDQLVAALSSPEAFEETKARLIEQGRTVEAELLTAIHNNNTSERPRLQARHWKLALEESTQIVSTRWKSIEAAVKKSVGRYIKTAQLDDNERHYANWLVSGCHRQFFWLMEGHIPDPSLEGLKRMRLTEKELAFCRPFEAPKRKRAIALHVRRLIARVCQRIRPPRCKAPKNRVDFDCSCYSVAEVDGEQWLSLMPLKEPKSKRIQVKLRGRSKVRGTIQLIREEAGRYTFRICQPVVCEAQRDESVRAGLDTGYTEVFVDHEGNAYGVGLGEKITEISDRRKEKGKRRNRLHAKVKNLRKSGKAEDARKARRIQRNNLGREKLTKRLRKDRETLKNIVNRTLNDLLRNNPKQLGVLVVEDLTKMKIKTVSKNWNRRLSSWVRGYIRQRLEEKCKRCGVKLISVNPAYTSITCPHCGYVDKQNRRGNKFKCCHCGWSGDADRVGAINILSRADNPDIGLKDSKRKVKAVLGKAFGRRQEELNGSTVHGRTSMTVSTDTGILDSVAAHGLHPCAQGGNAESKSG